MHIAQSSNKVLSDRDIYNMCLVLQMLFLVWCFVGIYLCSTLLSEILINLYSIIITLKNCMQFFLYHHVSNRLCAIQKNV